MGQPDFEATFFDAPGIDSLAALLVSHGLHCKKVADYEIICSDITIVEPVNHRLVLSIIMEGRVVQLSNFETPHLRDRVAAMLQKHGFTKRH